MTRLETRTVRWAGGIILAGILALRVLPFALGQVRVTGEALQQKRELLSLARAELMNTNILADSATRLTNRVAAIGPRLLNGSTTTEAAADLASRIALLANRYHLRLQRTEVSDTHTRPLERGVAAVTMRFHLQGDIRGIGSFLRALEESTLILVPDHLRISVGDRPSQDQGPECLEVDLVVSGWFLSGAGEA